MQALFNRKTQANQYCFKDVQLPLYLSMLTKNLLPQIDTTNAKFRVAYFCLGVNKDISGIYNFDECHLFQHDAETILFKTVEKIFFEQKFWPPNFKTNYKAEVLQMLGQVSLEDFEPIPTGESR